MKDRLDDTLDSEKNIKAMDRAELIIYMIIIAGIGILTGLGITL
jgi:hypothetical protein